MSATELNAGPSALTVLIDVVHAELIWVGNNPHLAYAVCNPEPYTQIHDTADC